ncbi:MAG: hypothetical protein WCP69_03765 [Bacteroidota bacterium]
MKKSFIKNPVLLIIVFFLYNCGGNTSNNQSIEKVVTTIVKRENAEFNLYEVKPNLYQVLDTVIESANACQDVKNKNFVYGLYVDDIDSATIIGIKLQDPRKRYCTDFEGVFIHKKAIFTYSGKFLSDFFIFRNQKVKFRCRIPDILKNDLDRGADNCFGFWKYALKNNKLKNVGYDICGKSWVDEKYSYYKAGN